MLLFVQIIGIVFMVSLVGMSVAFFILLNRIFNQLRYKNYVLEKLTQYIYMIAAKKDNSEKKENP